MSIVNEGNIGILREIYGHSLDEWGALMDVSGRFVQYVEKGARNLPKTRAEMLERELELTPEKLARLTALYEETRLT
ncbi:XRE family transcriptional regulator [Paenibacillus thailandensis]|uniref:XRE family transcriptional regulator n=1 Tax=Paenibacillus thailandensis TaxID=393250 RepID=A0ABW5R3P0_9BACL